jgi:hypothetical protein
MKSSIAALAAALLFCACPISASSSPPDLRIDDPALIQYIKETDLVFRSVLGPCQDESLHRAVNHGRSHFAYMGRCAINPRPQGECKSYHVAAAGSVDTSSTATVRNISLVLACVT